MKRKINVVEDNSENEIQLDSFGLWYKSAQNTEEKKSGKDKVEEQIKQDSDEELSKESSSERKAAFELHVNLWSKLRADGSKDDITLLDIGIKVKNYKSISELIFLCPFKFTADDIRDLSGKMQNKKNADLILNNNCELWTSDRYWLIKNVTSDNKIENLLIFSFCQSVDDVVDIEDVVPHRSSKLVIKFDLFKKYIESLGRSDKNRCDNGLQQIDDVYIRFRITSPELNKKLFSNLEPMNKFFQSAIASTQIIDFKMNSRRNIDDRILAKAIGNDEKFVAFNKIHFLLMEPSNNNVIFMSENNTTCRNLENGKWDNYLDCSGVKNILVYHWKKSVDAENECSGAGRKPIEEFNQLVKINYSKTNFKVIAWYLLVVFGLGIIGSYVTQLARYLIESLLKLMFK